MSAQNGEQQQSNAPQEQTPAPRKQRPESTTKGDLTLENGTFSKLKRIL
jgi:hypothetical protein